VRNSLSNSGNEIYMMRRHLVKGDPDPAQVKEKGFIRSMSVDNPVS
jgi:hypothetical protein